MPTATDGRMKREMDAYSRDMLFWKRGKGLQR